MTYVITQRCCNDASCVATCPTDCIRPTPDDPEFATAEMLYVDPQACIDCGACAVVCPTEAIFPADELVASLQQYEAINAEYFERNPLQPNYDVATTRPALPDELGALRVAVVGTGPAALYAAKELVRRGNVEVSVFDKLPTVGGLVRAGVAPDHTETKGIIDSFTRVLEADRVKFYLNVEVGEHVSHAELLEYHHAVVYGVGASTDRHLDIPGEDLPGSHSATEFVAWYNGHPDYADRQFDLSGERAVIVGNGNVALDVARILTLDPADLERTEIADYALKALRESKIREVVVLGRRGPAQAAYTSPELLALGHLRDVDVVVPEPVDAAAADSDLPIRLKVELAQTFSQLTPSLEHRRIVLRYLTSPVSVNGTEHAESLTIVRNELVEDDGTVYAKPTDTTEDIPTGLVLRSVGYRGVPVPDLPFDEKSGRVPNTAGRVSVPGAYVTGWIKRGPRGVIGTNRVDSQETVEAVLTDFRAGDLTRPKRDLEELAGLLRARRPELVDRLGWEAIDRAERSAGADTGRPRVKLTGLDGLLSAASSADRPAVDRVHPPEKRSRLARLFDHT